MSDTRPTRRSRARIALVAVPAFVLVLALVGALALWISLFRLMRPVETGRIDERVTALRDGSVNSYLYARDATIIAIDAGTSTTGELAALKAAGVEPSAVTALFLTHSDTDHAGGAAALPNAVLYMGEAEGELISGKTPRRFFGIPFRSTLDIRWTPVRDAATMTVGAVTVTAIHSPGHTPGSTCYLVDGTYLFTGDLMFLEGGRAAVSPWVINNDGAESARSLRKLVRQVSPAALTLVATAHTGVSRSPDTALSAWK
jgi:hydroxyacylglutathione hydrolase